LKMKKSYLTEILNMITEKERQEMEPLEWGKNSTSLPIFLPKNESVSSNDQNDLRMEDQNDLRNSDAI